MTEYQLGYLKALSDFEELLDNAVENGGGIHWGEQFIPRAHFDHELRDQIFILKEEVHDAQTQTKS